MALLSRSLPFAALLLGGALAATAPGQVPITTQRVASGLSAPLYVCSPPGDTARLFIVEQGSGGTARIKIMNLPGNTMVGTPFLTISGISTGGERGLLGLAFHPSYAANGRFFVYLSNSASQNSVREYTVSANPNVANTSFSNVMVMADPASNHNGGWIDFGPDGMLYIATGDGGSANDPWNNSQNVNVLLGKMLRVDVDGDDFPADANRNYRIPASNPFSAGGGSPEIWHIGLRNPWRCSFDAANGALYIADVGQNAWEWIHFQPAGVGGLNYGWRCTEGNACTGLSGCTCGSPALTPPIHVYSHSLGISLTGGYVYRGTALCGWQGAYFFGDYGTDRLWTLRYTGGGPVPATDRTSQLAPGGGLAINDISSFGVDALGEMYIVDLGGEVFKIVPSSSGGADCNLNGIPDACDILNGTSLDANLNGIPDECEPTITPYCFGDGSGTACPCGNAGAAGNGCGNSINAAGANLAGVGTPSVSNDSFVLIGAGMPNVAALYFQGTTQVAGGAGAVFGDGLRCASGTIIRLTTKTNVGGTSQYPEILDTQISIRGLITGGPTTRTYQTWYRNAAVFCQPETYNLTNALRVVWVN